MKKCKIKDLEVGDWFELDEISNNQFYVVGKFSDGSIRNNSPNYLYSSKGLRLINPEDDCIKIGTSKPNFWFKLFKFTDLVHPVKLKEEKSKLY